ncbi:MAG: CDP-alcohol phosphatidyltransferase family protein [Chloroflexi bacterium]|nr:CDP-alcohol phosphatidyltransferase family protein [Chloroflexota bacterium]
MFFIFVGAYFFITGDATLAVISLLLFFIHDSVDGDMARVSGGTSYGALMDSFGADFFYSLIPVSVGYFLYSIGTTVGPIAPSYVLLIGALTSISFLFYRLLNTKILTFFWDKKGGKEKTSVFDDESELTSPRGIFFRLAKLYRHTLIKGNFFAEPGMITWITIFVFLEQWEILGGYRFN